MILNAEQSCLLVVDVQKKLTPLVRDYKTLIENCQWMIKLARELDVDVLVSEHYPQGLGNTVDGLLTLINPDEVIDKVHFSCASDTTCMNRINALDKTQVVIIGIEAHVCILQTAIELHQKGKQVFVVEDSVSSRHLTDYQSGIARMRQVGIQILTKEMVFFEWLHLAGTAKFKALAKSFIA